MRFIPGRARVSRRRTFSVIGAVLVAFCCSIARAEKLALIHGTVINPGDAKVLPNAIVVIDGDKIASVSNDTKPPTDAREGALRHLYGE